jgi:hypothetical protein
MKCLFRVDRLDLLFDEYHFERAQGLSSFKFLHVQGTQTCIVEASRHDPKGVTHKYLVYPVARQQIGGGELHVVPGVGGRDGKHVILDARQQMVGFEHRERKRVQPEKPQQGVFGHHGYMDQQVSILAVI